MESGKRKKYYGSCWEILHENKTETAKWNLLGREIFTIILFSQEDSAARVKDIGFLHGNWRSHWIHLAAFVDTWVFLEALPKKICKSTI